MIQITLTPDQVLSIIRGAAEAMPVPAAPVPVAVPTAPATPVSAVTFTTVDGRRVDNITGTGTPGTITLSVTGHVLSLAQAAAGEMILGYALRVSKQAGVAWQAAVNMNGALALFQSALKTYGPTPDHWPIMVDEFYNHDAYNPVDPAEAARIAKDWADAQALMKAQAAAAGTSVPVATPASPPAVVEAPGNAP
jgi:hypothetical protein